ncbi:DUF4402 domain-containing protein [Phenylobacterium sp.]|uniref:DUF4402 domain-containing protein n=1 Tax=Phenylobacterium sp. TaxID=1871053 RepID=UPI0025EE97F9|nr:DUF4402 domain-containing protein [Phenylobacterium sp.]MBX3482262.1 DUF4402 domain-containing protein [Phenylobacterium sp.]
MKLRLAFAAFGAATLTAVAAQAADATANASATIVAPTQLAATRDLAFGTIAKPTAGTTLVTVASDPSNSATPTVSGGNGSIPTSGQARAATFRLIGNPGSTYTIGGNVLSFPGAGSNLISPASETPVASFGTVGTIPNSGATPGQQDLYVGGRFSIDTNTAPNTYNGTLVLTVTFN